MKANFTIQNFIAPITYKGHQRFIKVSRHLTTYDNGSVDVDYDVTYEEPILPPGYPGRELVVGFKGRLFFAKFKMPQYHEFIEAVKEALDIIIKNDNRPDDLVD